MDCLLGSEAHEALIDAYGECRCGERATERRGSLGLWDEVYV